MELNKEDDEVTHEEASGTVVPTTSDSPYMVIHHERKQTFYSISKGMYSVRSVPAMYGTTCCASYRGWLVMLDNNNSCSSNRFCFLLNSVSMEQIKLPMINTSYQCDQCILTASPPDDCLVMFLSFRDNSCLFCRPNDKRWIKNSLGPKWENYSYCASTGNCFQVLLGGVSCKGKIYINYGHEEGMKILDYKIDPRTGNRLTVEKIKFDERLTDNGYDDRFISQSPTSNYMVESCGEVFLVERIYVGESTSNTYSFSVYKLTSTTNNKGGRRIAWKKVESLGDDRVFFVARSCSISVSASKAGLVENHIYFFHPLNATYLLRFNMDTGSIYQTQSFPHLVASNCRNKPYWMISDSIL